MTHEQMKSLAADIGELCGAQWDGGVGPIETLLRARLVVEDFRGRDLLAQDLATLVRRLLRRLGTSGDQRDGTSKMIDQANDFLRRSGLQGDCLR